MSDGLAKKVRLQGGQQAAVLNAPEGYVRGLVAPVDVTVVTRAQGACDFVQLFAASRSELETLDPRVLKILKPDGLLWLTYPKASSHLAADLSRDRGWDVLDRARLCPLRRSRSTRSASPSDSGRRSLYGTAIASSLAPSPFDQFIASTRELPRP